MAGLWTRPSVARVAATSASLVSMPYCAEITSYPSACSGPVSLFQHEPSAQIPWQNTMLGLVCGDIVHSFGLFWSSGPGNPRAGHADPGRRLQLQRGCATITAVSAC